MWLWSDPKTRGAFRPPVRMPGMPDEAQGSRIVKTVAMTREEALKFRDRRRRGE